MNGLAFLVMLASFALVMGWYVLNHERDQDGRDGILGVRTGGEDAAKKEKPKAPPPRARWGHAEPTDPAERVRARAAAARAREKR